MTSMTISDLRCSGMSVILCGRVD